MERILRRALVLEYTGLSKSNLYRLITEDAFPRPVRLGKKSVGWRASAVQEWIATRPEVEATSQTSTKRSNR